MRKNQIVLNRGVDPIKMTQEILEKCRLEEMVDPGMDIVLKPNLVVAKPAQSGATSHPEIAEAIIQYLLNHGCKKISICEGSWTGAQTNKAFKVCGYQDISRRYNIGLIDLKNDKMLHIKEANFSFEVCEKTYKADFLINLPVLKGHCQVQMTCALKNMKGCISDREKRRFHSLGLQYPIAYLNRVLHQDFIVVDALQGDLSFEEGGNPVRMDRIFAGIDPVLIDAYSASLMGFSKGEIPYIDIAEEIGLCSADLSSIELIELEQSRPQIKHSSQFQDNRAANSSITQLTRYITASDACSACYAGLIHALQRLKKEGQLKKLNYPLYLGQGYKRQKHEGVGIGSCTQGFSHHLPGCPPNPVAIVEFLKSISE